MQFEFSKGVDAYAYTDVYTYILEYMHMYILCTYGVSCNKTKVAWLTLVIEIYICIYIQTLVIEIYICIYIQSISQ